MSFPSSSLNQSMPTAVKIPETKMTSIHEFNGTLPIDSQISSINEKVIVVAIVNPRMSEPPVVSGAKRLTLLDRNSKVPEMRLVTSMKNRTLLIPRMVPNTSFAVTTSSPGILDSGLSALSFCSLFRLATSLLRALMKSVDSPFL